jgi:hypothetical protein
MRQPFKGENIQFELPCSWSDVTLGEWIEILKISKEPTDKFTDLRIVAALSGLSYGVVQNFSLSTWDQIAVCIDFIKTDEIDYKRIAASKAPYQFTVNGKIYNPTINFNKFRTAQMIAYQDMFNEGKVPEEKISKAIAICLVRGEYSDELVNELEKGVMSLPFIDALCLHGFFLNTYLSLITEQKPKAESQHLKKLHQVLRKSRKSTNGFTRFIRSLMGIKPKNPTISI